MTAILVALLAGAVVGATGWDRVLPGRVWDLLSRLALLVLLGVMGLRLGTDAGVAAAAASLGTRAVVFALATAGGPLLAGWLGQALFSPAAWQAAAGRAAGGRGGRDVAPGRGLPARSPGTGAGTSARPAGPATPVVPEPGQGAAATLEPGPAAAIREPGSGAGTREPGPAAGTREAFRMSLLAIAAVGTGLAAGRAALAAAGAGGAAAPGAPGGAGITRGIGDARGLLDPAATVLLLVLLALYGREFGRQWQAVRAFILSARWRLLLVPLVGGLGSLAGGLAAGWLTGTSPREALAAAAAFGWYSLAGVLVDRLAGPAAGALAFLANVLRELLAVLAVPLLAPRLGPARRWLLVLPGGATTMDTSLPVIAAATDAPTTALAFLHGLILTMLAPPLILWLAR